VNHHHHHHQVELASRWIVAVFAVCHHHSWSWSISKRCAQRDPSQWCMSMSVWVIQRVISSGLLYQEWLLAGLLHNPSWCHTWQCGWRTI